MRIFTRNGVVVIDGERHNGSVYIVPHSCNDWATVDRSAVEMRNWFAVRPNSSFRLIRMLSLIPYIWRASK